MEEFWLLLFFQCFFSSLCLARNSILQCSPTTVFAWNLDFSLCSAKEDSNTDAWRQDLSKRWDVYLAECPGTQTDHDIQMKLTMSNNRNWIKQTLGDSRSWETLNKWADETETINTQTSDWWVSGDSRGIQLEQINITRQGKQKWTKKT